MGRQEGREAGRERERDEGACERRWREERAKRRREGRIKGEMRVHAVEDRGREESEGEDQGRKADVLSVKFKS